MPILIAPSSVSAYSAEAPLPESNAESTLKRSDIHIQEILTILWKATAAESISFLNWHDKRLISNTGKPPRSRDKTSS